ncbi:MAG: FtsX-like permease family protein [Candidatus Lokiarchaeota archaeon]|nr:FtsX-like permease family protein [Candidatus Lokiarchaeota archaeon]MBD3337989.1 FtsX-like permease family protein [Candidatus Lokiarchaeota archaeon]
MSHFLKPYNLTIESLVNTTVDNLAIYALNHYTGLYDKLGNINNTAETNNTFTFNQYYPPYSYINQSTSLLTLKIIGENSTYDSDYELTIDSLSFQVFNSTYSIINPSTWPEFKVIGIINNPVLYRTERYNWLAGYEVGLDVTGAENSIYINYQNARNYVYPMYNGSLNNGTNDFITTVYIHCDSVDDISSVKGQLQNNLGPYYTIPDLKSDTIEFRNYAFDWYIWLEEGFDDEEVLEELTEFIEDNGYVVLFGFTNSFITSIFESMIDLITMIMNGILIFAIVISMIGLALHCLLSTMARRREIGMLRSIGLSKKGVVRTVSGETLVVALLGALIGIFAGILTGTLMVTAVPQTSFLAVTLVIPWLTIGILVLVTLATAIVSSRYPSKWAANINIIDAVRTR